MTESGILQVPPTLMDGGIFYEGPERLAGTDKIRDHLRRVMAVGGAAVLDWHLEQSNPTRLFEAGPALIDALQSIRGQSDVWVATPLDLAEWWTERRRRMARATRPRVRLRGPVPSEARQRTARSESPAAPAARK